MRLLTSLKVSCEGMPFDNSRKPVAPSHWHNRIFYAHPVLIAAQHRAQRDWAHEKQKAEKPGLFFLAQRHNIKHARPVQQP